MYFLEFCKLINCKFEKRWRKAAGVRKLGALSECLMIKTSDKKEQCFDLSEVIFKLKESNWS